MILEKILMRRSIIIMCNMNIINEWLEEWIIINDIW